MHRSELRRQVLKGFYDKDDGRYHDPFGEASTTQEKVAIEAACRQHRNVKGDGSVPNPAEKSINRRDALPVVVSDMPHTLVDV